MAKTADEIKILGTYGTMYYVKDMGKATAFFKKNLGLKPSRESAEWTEFSLPGHALCLHSGLKEDAPRSGILILHVENVKAARSALLAKGLKVSTINEVHPGAHACDFTDVDGNAMAIYQGPKSA
jgi:hypothetical protein